MDLKLYDSDRYESSLSYPVLMELGDPIHMKIELDSKSKLKLYPQNCFATPSQDKENEIKEYLVQDR